MSDRLTDAGGAPLPALLLGVPNVVHVSSVPSTMDLAHQLAAAGAPAGTVVLADEQTAGRGRNGRAWHSAPLGGVWLTVIERPDDVSGLDVLSLRLGLRLAHALERFAEGPVSVKWPNDLFLASRKLAGVLVEARWRGGVPDWVAVGIGINLGVPPGVTAGIPPRVPAGVSAAALRRGVARDHVFATVVAVARDAARARGALSPAELDAFARRDVARGRPCTAPARGVVQGISSAGELVIATATGPALFRSGSLAFAGDAP